MRYCLHDRVYKLRIVTAKILTADKSIVYASIVYITYHTNITYIQNVHTTQIYLRTSWA